MCLRTKGIAATAATALAAIGLMLPGPASASASAAAESEAGHRRHTPLPGRGDSAEIGGPAGEAGTSAWCRRSQQGDGGAPRSGPSAYGHC